MKEPKESFDWDNANVHHLSRHRIQPEEAEECFGNDPIIREHDVVDGEDRWTAVGSTNALRILVLVFTVRNGKIRPITGWEADRRTKADYLQEKVIGRIWPTND